MSLEMCDMFVSDFSADGGVKSTAALTPAGPTARRSRSECGQVASSFCVKEVLWVKMVPAKPG